MPNALKVPGSCSQVTECIDDPTITFLFTRLISYPHFYLGCMQLKFFHSWWIIKLVQQQKSA